MNLKLEMEAALTLSRLPGVGAATFKELLQQHHLPSVALLHFKAIKSNKKAQMNASPVLQFLEENSDIQLFWPFHKSYPKSLSQITEPPPVLFTKGNAKILNSKKRKVAIVGARKASASGLELTQKITKQLCQNGAIIISGLAEGIDTCAHQLALQEGAETIAVMATGVDICFPKKNLALYNEIALKGAICTEFFPGTPPIASFFPTRNRIIAALADSIIMIEGTAKSGALYTVRNGIKFDKKVFVGNYEDLPLIKEGLIKAQSLGADIY